MFTFPSEAITKAQTPSQIADQLYMHCVWIARWSNEILADPSIDVKKLAQLARSPVSHCGRLLALSSPPISAELREAVWNRFTIEGRANWATRQEMIADFQAIRADADALVQHITANMAAETRVLECVAWELDGTKTIEPRTIAKPDAVEALVQALRDNFTA